MTILPGGVSWWAQIIETVDIWVQASLGLSAQDLEVATLGIISEASMSVVPQSVSTAEVGMSAHASVGMTPPSSALANVDISTISSIGMIGNGKSTRALPLSVSSLIGVAAAGKSIAALPLSVVSGIAVTGVGHSVVSYQATGVGAADLGSSFSYNHTGTAGDDLIVEIFINTGTISSVKYDNVSMTPLGTSNAFGQYGGRLARYRMTDIPGGTKLVEVQLSTTAYYSSKSVSYNGVVNVGTTTFDYGYSGTPTQSGTCDSGEMIINSLAGSTGYFFTNLSGGTNRYNLHDTTGYANLVFNDSSSDATFSCAAGDAISWAAAKTVLSGE